MELKVKLQTGGSSSSPQLVCDKDGRWRDIFGRFAKRKTSSVQTTTDMVEEVLPEVMPEVMPEAEIASDLSIIRVAIDTPRIHQRIGYALLSFTRFGSMFLGVVGGTYAILRPLGCSLVFDDSFEITINRAH